MCHSTNNGTFQIFIKIYFIPTIGPIYYRPTPSQLSRLQPTVFQPEKIQTMRRVRTAPKSVSPVVSTLGLTYVPSTCVNSFLNRTFLFQLFGSGGHQCWSSPLREQQLGGWPVHVVWATFKTAFRSQMKSAVVKIRNISHFILVYFRDGRKFSAPFLVPYSY